MVVGMAEWPVRDGPFPPEIDAACLAEILEIVLARTGLDFRSYRHATLMRRVHNRMIVASVRSLPEYCARLRAEPAEAHVLVERLTLKVSRFFRDAWTFRALHEALARRLEGRREARLSVWSAGCARGEEPYGLAILLRELGLGEGEAEILATDVDLGALAAAARGCYPAAALEGVDAGRRSRWFEEGPNGLAVVPAVRRAVTLLRHDLTGAATAPDGRRFDLVCCRNVLIYLQPALQERVERMVAGSLRPGGLLCLGEAEWLAPPVAALFDVVDRRARLFQLRPPQNEASP